VDERLTVRVIGGGPAGLEAARTAAGRGHDVHLYERGERLGGRLRRDAETPGRERMGLAADWLAGAVERAGASVHVGTEVTPETVAGWDADDVVVVATGAVPVVDEVPGVRTVPLAEAVRRAGELAGPVVVVDEVEDEPVYAFVTALAARGTQVRLVTRREAPARRVAYVSRIGVSRRLDEAGVEVHVLVEPVRAEGGRLVARHVYSGRERDLGPVGTVVLAGPSAPGQHPAGARDALVIGDASSPRSYVAVSQEAHDVAAGLGHEKRE
jgi:thioredoxin reductase